MTNYDYEFSIKKMSGPILPEELFLLFDTVLGHMKYDYRDIQRKLAEDEFREIQIRFDLGGTP